jgi:dCTP deaminase
MTLLSDTDIRALLRLGRLQVEPFDPAALQPASLDLTLGDTLLALDPDVLWVDPADDQTDVWLPMPPNPGWALAPGAFVLGSTRERITLPPNLVARVEGRSSLGRCGLLVHATAGFVDPGWSGPLTLEIHNLLPVPIILRPGMGIAQLAFQRLSSQASRPYGSAGLGSKYQGATGVEASKGVSR